jgi:hypothetical protein
MEKEGLLPFLDIDAYRKLNSSLVIKSIGGPPIPIFIYIGIHITTLQTNNQSWLP